MQQDEIQVRLAILEDLALELPEPHNTIVASLEPDTFEQLVLAIELLKDVTYKDGYDDCALTVIERLRRTGT